MPTCCSMSRLVITAPMRLCARGPSGTLTASTPSRFSAATSESILLASTPRGGTISTDVTISPFAIFAAKCERSANGTGVTPFVWEPGTEVRGAVIGSRFPAPRSRRFGSPFPVPGSHYAGGKRADSGYDRADVVRRRPATPTDDLRARLDEMARIGRHVLRARHVHAAPAHVARHARVRLCAQLPA